MTVVWIVSIIASILAGFSMYSDLHSATSAPQQGAAAAIACAIAIIPYCIARGMGEVVREDREKRLDEYIKRVDELATRGNSQSAPPLPPPEN